MIDIKTGEVFTNHKGERCIVLKMYARSKIGAYYVVWFPETCQYQIVYDRILFRGVFYDASRPFVCNSGFSKGSLEKPAITNDYEYSNISYMWKNLLNRTNSPSKQINIFSSWYDYMIFREWALQNYTVPQQKLNDKRMLLTRRKNCYSPDVCYIATDWIKVYWYNHYSREMTMSTFAKQMLNQYRNELNEIDVKYLEDMCKWKK